MRNDLTVSLSVEINAELSKVWKGLTDPEIIKEYLFGTETVTDWKVGSEIIFQGQQYRDKGVIKEFAPNKKISYSYWSGFTGLEDKPENYSLVTYTVSSSDNKKTVFTWTQQGFANEDAYKHSLTGMEAFLNQIKEIIER